MDRPTVFVDPSGEIWGIPGPGELIGDAWDKTKDVASDVWGVASSAAEWAWRNASCIAKEHRRRRRDRLRLLTRGAHRSRTIAMKPAFAGIAEDPEPAVLIAAGLCIYGMYDVYSHLDD